uniref:Uncharacterized protein n=1 Tax=Aegilops tauschii subsp. strangulata TaxID=200361 RepID=A0A453C219_AEGTS
VAFGLRSFAASYRPVSGLLVSSLPADNPGF